MDIENHTYLSFYDEGYEECDFPTLNDLYQNGILIDSTSEKILQKPSIDFFIRGILLF